MKIIFVYKEDYPWDVRVEKIITSLKKNGHSITLLCRNTKNYKRIETTESMTIKRLPCYSKFFGKFGLILDTPFYFNPIWFLFIYLETRKLKPELLIIRDLPLMLCAIIVSKIKYVPVVYDMAECYPEMYKSKLLFAQRLEKLKLYLFKNHKLASIVERISVSKANHIFVMIQESYDRLTKMNINKYNISIVSNTPITENTVTSKKNHIGEKIKLLYVGFLGASRGIDNMLYGISYYCKNYCRNISFDIVGIGSEREKLKELAIFLEINDLIQFHGWLDHNSVKKLYENSNIGVLTYHTTPHWNTTIPNKLFDYMYNKLPIVSSEIQPIKKIIFMENCGIVVDCTDSRKIAFALNTLSDYRLRQKMGDNGLHAVTTKYNWEYDEKRLLNVINSFAVR